MNPSSGGGHGCRQNDRDQRIRFGRSKLLTTSYLLFCPDQFLHDLRCISFFLMQETFVVLGSLRMLLLGLHHVRVHLVALVSYLGIFLDRIGCFNSTDRK